MRYTRLRFVQKPDTGITRHIRFLRVYYGFGFGFTGLVLRLDLATLMAIIPYYRSALVIASSFPSPLASVVSTVSASSWIFQNWLGLTSRFHRVFLLFGFNNTLNHYCALIIIKKQVFYFKLLIPIEYPES